MESVTNILESIAGVIWGPFVLIARETKAYLKFDPKLNKPDEEVEAFVRSQQMEWK